MLVTCDSFPEPEDLPKFDAGMRIKKEPLGILHLILPPGFRCLLEALRINLELLEVLAGLEIPQDNERSSFRMMEFDLSE